MRRLAYAALLGCATLVAAALPAAAQDATWTPGTGDFNTPGNWTPATVPTGTAFFGTASTTTLSFSATTALGGWTFNAGASNYTFNNTQSVSFTGAGIVINGGSATITNNFPGDLFFYNNSTAGSATITSGGGVQFHDSSTAGSAIITNNDGQVDFFGNSTAGSATISNKFFGILTFHDSSTAGSATITVNNDFVANGNAGLFFEDTSNAGSATISNTNYGRIFFIQNSSAGSATITNNYILSFNETSTAGSAHITNNAISFFFNDSSTAGSATIINNNLMAFENTSTAGSATITNNQILVFNDTSTAGSATITNNEGLTFDDGTTAGSATITNTSTGELFFEAATAGSASITNNGSLEFILGSTADSASITNSSGGTLTFKDNSTAGSASINNGGAIIFNNSSTAGSAGITNNPAGVIGFHDTSTAGSAGIANNGGTLNFFDNSTAGSAGITNNSLGVIGFHDTSTAGSAAIASNGGTLDFFDNSTAGSAGITNNSLGVIAFENASTAGNATITNNGNIDFSNSSTAGSASITNSGGLITFDNTSTGGSATITNSGTIIFNDASTGGSATIANNGHIRFFDTSTAGNAALTNTGGSAVVDFSASTGPNNDGKLGAGSIAGGGNFYLGSDQLTVGGNNSSATVSGVISDCGGGADCQNAGVTGGSLVKSGTGTLTLTGADTYTGGTQLNGGTLIVGNNSALGTGTLAMAAGTTLEFLNTGNFTIANPITITGDPDFAPPSGTTQALSGVIANGATPGTLVMNGFGTLVLSGANTYTGPTNVTAGTLTVNGSIAASNLTTVSSGATLNGTGTVGNLQVSNGGVFAPGSGTAGTSTTVAGGLTLGTASTYQVFVNPATASSATVSGTAALGGAKVSATFANGRYISKIYTILTGGSVSGTFGTLTNINLPANFTDALSYDATHAYLDLTLGLTPTTTMNTNQRNVAATLVDYFNTTGGIPTKFGTLTFSGLTQVDGEDATGAERGGFELTNEFLGLMLDPFVYGRGGPASGGGRLGFAPDQQASFPSDVALAYAGILKAPPKSQDFGQRWTVWGAGFGGSGTANGDPTAGSNNVTASTYGFAAGADYHVSPDTVLGFALAGSGTNWNLANALGTGRSDAFQAGVYGTRYFGPAYIGAAFAFTNNWFTTNRTALGDQLTASFQGQSFGARVESGYRYAVAPAAGVTPYAAIQAQSFYTPGYSETDLTGGGFGLSYNAMSATDTRSELGARFDALTALGVMPVQLRARLAWAHDWVSNPALDASFQALPGTSFVVNGAPVPHDSALTSVGAEMRLTSRWTLLGKFDGEFASSAQIYAGSGTLRYTW
ncbi:MAG TPA: autotransporter domain-containing protein [Xanthobacteraceae bacterium]|nr:autotransporter domain-containing protein [Xanthobacteraceae bacterium]